MEVHGPDLDLVVEVLDVLDEVQDGQDDGVQDAQFVLNARSLEVPNLPHKYYK